VPETRPRIGVFVCHCGKNIAGTVDVAKVAEAASRFPGVVYATHYEYMCSDPGQALIQRAIGEHRLNGVVVAACSPTMHEETFRRAASAAGLNPYLVDIANAGFEVLLVEKSPSIGGHMAQLSETFPTLDCSQCILTPKMVEVSRHPQIRLLAYSEVPEVSGFVGNYRVRIRKKPTYVDPEKCNLCGTRPETGESPFWSSPRPLSLLPTNLGG